MRPIALVTDFGARDPYVAAVKGVIAARTAAPIHDLSHEIAPFDILEAAWFLRSVLPYWNEAVLVCVVDPGVGTSRRLIAMEVGTNVVLAPDNGALTFVGEAAFSIERTDLFLPTAATTFHGRDRFAPVAAALANGLAPRELGPPVRDLVRLDYTPPSYAADVVRGTVVAVDRFGNVITDIERDRIPFERFRIGGVDRLETTYRGEGAFLIAGSSGTIEISVANGSAADHLHMSRLDRVELWPNDDASSGS